MAEERCDYRDTTRRDDRDKKVRVKWAGPGRMLCPVRGGNQLPWAATARSVYG